MLQIKTPVTKETQAKLDEIEANKRLTSDMAPITVSNDVIADAVLKVQRILDKLEETRREEVLTANISEHVIHPDVVRELLHDVEQNQAKSLTEAFAAGWNAALIAAKDMLVKNRSMRKRDKGTAMWYLGSLYKSVEGDSDAGTR